MGGVDVNESSSLILTPRLEKLTALLISAKCRPPVRSNLGSSHELLHMTS